MPYSSFLSDRNQIFNNFHAIDLCWYFPIQYVNSYFFSASEGNNSISIGDKTMINFSVSQQDLAQFKNNYTAEKWENYDYWRHKENTENRIKKWLCDYLESYQYYGNSDGWFIDYGNNKIDNRVHITRKNVKSFWTSKKQIILVKEICKYEYNEFLHLDFQKDLMEVRKNFPQLPWDLMCRIDFSEDTEEIKKHAKELDQEYKAVRKHFLGKKVRVIINNKLCDKARELEHLEVGDKGIVLDVLNDEEIVVMFEKMGSSRFDCGNPITTDIYSVEVVAD
jgi:hypothetical protein